MREPTKEELLDFMRKHEPEKVDSITDTESAIRHFRCTSEIYKEQRDQYKAECERLERENEKLENKLEGAETYIDAIKTYKPMYEKLRKQYITLTSHIRLKAETNPSVSRYIDLVNYIDRLERD